MSILKPLFGMLIGLIFITGTVYISIETVIPYIQSWKAMKLWNSTQATLLSTGKSDHNLTATYLYIVKDDVFQNNRVYISPLKFDVGHYHQEMQIKLQKLIEKQEMVTIWYDPNQPIQSVIDKDLRWDLLSLMTVICLFVFLIGLLICYHSFKSYYLIKSNIKGLIQSETGKKLLQAGFDKDYIDYEDDKENYQTDTPKIRSNNSELKPWLVRKEWRNSRISSISAKTIVFMWIVTVFWTALSLPFIWVLEEELQQKNYGILIGLLFLLSGLYMIKYTWQKTREWQRFGDVKFEMDPFPGSIGGHVGGKILLKNEQINHANYNIELECVYSYVSGAGKHSTRLEQIKWAEGGNAKTKIADGTQLNFRFNIPEYLPEADVKESRQYNLWRLKLSSDLPETNLQREFIIPVFKTKTKSAHIEHDISAENEKARKIKKLQNREAIKQADFSSTPLRHILIYKDMGDYQLFYFPMFRKKLQTILAIVCTIVFIFVAYAMNKYTFTTEVINVSTLMFSLPFAVMGLISSITMIYLPFNNLRVIITEQDIKAVRRLFIIPIRQNIIHKDDILKIRAKESGVKGKGINQIKQYKLTVYTHHNKKIKISENIEGKDLAYQFNKFICKQLSIA